MDKQVDMQAFVGVDFDCEFAENPGAYGNCGLLTKIIEGALRPYEIRSRYRQRFCRPRLNKPQVVKDGQISWIPDGLVWNAFGEYPDYCGGDSDFFSLEVIRSQRLRDVLAGYAIWIECIGAEPDYTEWANAHGVPVVEVSNG